MTEHYQHSQHSQSRPSGSDPDDGGSTHYTMWSVFELASPATSDTDRTGEAAEVSELLDRVSRDGVTVRGCYDVSGFRADADLMLWCHSPSAEPLQGAYNALRRTALGARLVPVWSQFGVHRGAEFNKSHVPAFLAGEEPREFLCVYPFVRSYEWYLLPDTERRDLLAEHGRMARDFPDVRANTVAAFALGDYEWLLAFEADDLHRIVDLMRHLRGSGARRHVREEVPFFTGRRRNVEELLTGLP